MDSKIKIKHFNINPFIIKFSVDLKLRNESYYEDLPYIYNTDATHAIYSHSYDPSGTKLLTVGGPLTVNFFGHYAGIWR